MIISKTASLALAGLLATSATPALAASTIWFNGGGTTSGNGQIFTDGDVSVRATAWSVNSGTINDGTLGVYSSGLGVNNSSGDNSHTIDNSGWTDFVVLQFDTAVQLVNGSFKTGWHGMNDTDATIGYGNSALPFTTDLAIDGQNVSALAFMNFYESGSAGKSGNSTRNINPFEYSGNTWVISASSNNPDSFKDGFKFKSVSFETVAAVPEPSTWAMMLLGFFGIGGVMRRKAAVAATNVSYA